MIFSFIKFLGSIYEYVNDKFAATGGHKFVIVHGYLVISVWMTIKLYRCNVKIAFYVAIVYICLRKPLGRVFR